ncbi:hypothetical protein FHT79_005046 [Rhizobium sp. BK212]|uniref:hypothetical protein n=1 Tax=Rhizobium sp. BK212 TaxID=2587074 RepID=UPI001813AE97|nr:hypothetical protein [Rhizobium sp. BK212]MBB4217828.1 hypothetical protein [Rhizobium sp. BK212]
MAEIIPFPNQAPNTSIDVHDLNVAGVLSGDPDMEQMLQARARIQKVLDELDRLSGTLQTGSASTGAAG